MARNARLGAGEPETPYVVTAMPSPPGAGFAYDTGVKKLDAQMTWISALDTKAGILLGGDGIVASLVFTKDSLLASLPKGLQSESPRSWWDP